MKWLICLFLFVSTYSYAQSGSTVTKIPLKEIKRIYFKINNYRKAKGLRPLIFSEKIEKGCAEWAKYCTEKDIFVHKVTGIMTIKSSECMHKRPYSKELNEDHCPALGWYKSKPHHKIIMDYRAKYVGIAGYSDGNYDIFVLRIVNVK